MGKGKAGNTPRINLSAKSESAVAPSRPKQTSKDQHRPEQTNTDKSNIPVQCQLSQRRLAGIYAIYLKNYVFGFVLWGNGSTCREHGNPVKCCALNPRSQKPQPGIEIICNTLLVQSWRAINIAASQRAKWRQKLATRKQQTWLCMNDPRGETHTLRHTLTQIHTCMCSCVCNSSGQPWQLCMAPGQSIAKRGDTRLSTVRCRQPAASLALCVCVRVWQTIKQHTKHNSNKSN